MSAISLINSGVAWFVAAAVLAFLFSFQKALSGWIAGIGGAVGSLYTAAAGFTVLTGAVGVSGALSLVSYDVQISPLNAIWLITLGLCGLFVSLYNIDWHRHAQVKCNGLQINMLMAAAVCAVIASNLGMFVVMAEIMALCAVFLTSNSKEGKLWFALGRLGTLLLAIACWLLWQRYGTLDLRLLDMRMQQLPLGFRYLAARSDWLWPAGRDYSAARLGAAGTCERLCASCRVVFYGSHENWPAGHFNPVTAGR